MIKNPKIGQTVWFVDWNQVVSSEKITWAYQDGVQLDEHGQFRFENIFPSEKAAIKHALKRLNKTIFWLSKRREKLANRLAQILNK